MNIRYTRRAVAQLVEIHTYIAADRPNAARSVGESIRSAVSNLAVFPEAGRLGRIAGTRELLIPRLPFIVAYRIKDGSIDVLAILHGARRWPNTFASR